MQKAVYRTAAYGLQGNDKRTPRSALLLDLPLRIPQSKRGNGIKMQYSRRQKITVGQYIARISVKSRRLQR